MPCTCRRSGCLKLYCVCFAAGASCDKSCKCTSCGNTDEAHGVNDRLEKARKRVREKYGEKGFTPVRKKRAGGCKCKKNECRKKYCVCFQAGKPCGHECVCEGCKNCKYEERPQMDFPMTPPPINVGDETDISTPMSREERQLIDLI